MMHQKLELELATPLRLPENTVPDSLIEKTKKSQKSAEHIAMTQNKIKQIKTALDEMIQAMNNNPSVLSRAALYWDDVALWQKITGGVVLTLPLIIGVMTNLIALITLSLVAITLYSAGSILLDDHHRQNTDNTERLSAGVSSLADLLGNVISILELVGEQFEIEIDLFQKENKCLNENIEQFGKQIKTLTSQMNGLTDAEKALRKTQADLEQTVATFKGSLDEQSQLLENTQKKLDKVAQESQENQDQLSDKIKELDEVKTKMSKEVAYAQSAVLILKGTVETFSKCVIQDKEQRAGFQKRLEEFLTNKEKSFVEVVDRLSDTESKLSEECQRLKESNLRHRALLDQQEQQIIRLKQIDAHPPIDAQESVNPIKPSINGFYAIKKAPPLFAEAAHEATINAAI